LGIEKHGCHSSSFLYCNSNERKLSLWYVNFPFVG
jgi:hypothetical protein